MEDGEEVEGSWLDSGSRESICAEQWAEALYAPIPVWM